MLGVWAWPSPTTVNVVIPPRSHPHHPVNVDADHGDVSGERVSPAPAAGKGGCLSITHNGQGLSLAIRKCKDTLPSVCSCCEYTVQTGLVCSCCEYTVQTGLVCAYCIQYRLGLSVPAVGIQYRLGLSVPAVYSTDWASLCLL